MGEKCLELRNQLSVEEAWRAESRQLQSCFFQKLLTLSLKQPEKTIPQGGILLKASSRQNS